MQSWILTFEAATHGTVSTAAKAMANAKRLVRKSMRALENMCCLILVAPLSQTNVSAKQVKSCEKVAHKANLLLVSIIEAPERRLT
jgi:hypothetical protein